MPWDLDQDYLSYHCLLGDSTDFDDRINAGMDKTVAN